MTNYLLIKLINKRINLSYYRHYNKTNSQYQQKEFWKSKHRYCALIIRPKIPVCISGSFRKRLQLRELYANFRKFRTRNFWWNASCFTKSTFFGFSGNATRKFLCNLASFGIFGKIESVHYLFNKLTSVFHASVLLLITNFVITLTMLWRNSLSITGQTH